MGEQRQHIFRKNQDYHEFGPHIGLAYQLQSKLVLRGGYGIFYTPLALNQWNGGSFATSGGAFGFIGSNNVVNTLWTQSDFSGTQATRDRMFILIALQHKPM